MFYFKTYPSLSKQVYILCQKISACNFGLPIDIPPVSMCEKNVVP